MNIRLVSLLLACVLIAASSPALGQECTIAAYADAAGTQSEAAISNWQLDVAEFSIYIVMFVESTANAAAYKATFSGFDNGGWFLQSRVQGSSGQGLFIDENPASVGTNVALGECVVGFGGVPVLVEEYQYLVLMGYDGGQSVVLSANTNQDPDAPVYVPCSSTKRQCEVGPEFYVSWIFPAGKSSFGQIKSLYN